MSTQHMRPAASMSTADRGHFDGREMAMVHKMFRRELSLLPVAVRKVAANDVRRARCVAAHLRMVGDALHHHHRGEDRYVWPLLAIRAPARVADHLADVVSQHRRIDGLQADVDDALSVWASDAGVEARDRLALAMEHLATAVVGHMDQEEAHIVPVMESVIGLAEWNQIAQAMTSGLADQDAVLVLGMSMYEGDRDIVERTIANMPPTLRAGIAAAATHAYAQRAALVYGTPTPPRSE